MSEKAQVSQYLFYAQSLINEFKSPLHGEAEKVISIGLRKAQLNAICLTIASTWQAWQRELVGYHKLTSSEPGWVFDEQFQYLPDAQYIVGLKSDPTSWLAIVLQLQQNPLDWLSQFDPAPGSEAGNEQISSNVIPLVTVSEQDEGNDAGAPEEVLLRVVNEFKAYLESAREQQSEW